MSLEFDSLRQNGRLTAMTSRATVQALAVKGERVMKEEPKVASATKPDGPVATGKKPYTRPQLKEYGKLRTTTTGGTGAVMESGSNKQTNKHP